MAFNMVTAGNGWRLAGSLIQLGHEVAAAHPDFTCLGTIGDQSHVTEGTASDHNPFVKDPRTGVGIVRAIDIGGPDAELKALRQLLWQAYAETDNRVYEYGYMKGCSDNLINNWGLPFGTHVDGGDAGHLHVSVTQSNGNHPAANGYVAAIDDTRPWGITAAGLVAPASAATAPEPAVKLWQGYPVPALIARGTNQYFGLITGPAASHGGYYASERPMVTVLQQRLNACGWATTADGQFGPATAASVTAFQHAHMPGTQFYGQVWFDDWATLFNL